MRTSEATKRSQLNGLMLLLISEGKCKLSDLPLEYRYLHPEFYYTCRQNAQCGSDNDVAEFCTLLFDDYKQMPYKYKELFESLIKSTLRWHDEVIKAFDIKTPRC